MQHGCGVEKRDGGFCSLQPAVPNTSECHCHSPSPSVPCLNRQSLAVVTGLGPKGRAPRAMAATGSAAATGLQQPQATCEGDARLRLEVLGAGDPRNLKVGPTPAPASVGSSHMGRARHDCIGATKSAIQSCQSLHAACLARWHSQCARSLLTAWSLPPRVQVPKELGSRVTTHPNVDFVQYYGIMQRTVRTGQPVSQCELCSHTE